MTSRPRSLSEYGRLMEGALESPAFAFPLQPLPPRAKVATIITLMQAELVTCEPCISDHGGARGCD